MEPKATRRLTPMKKCILLGLGWILLVVSFCLGQDVDLTKKEQTKKGLAETLNPELTAKIAGFSNYVSVLRDDKVRAELKLGESQRKNLDKELNNLDLPFWQARDIKMAEIIKKKGDCFDHLDNALAKILTVTQKRRADGLFLQVHGWPSLVIPKIGDRFGVKPDLRGKIQSLIEAERSATGKKEGPLSSDCQTKIKNLFSVNQLRTLEKASGASFDFSKIVFRACLVPEFGQKEEWVNSKPLGPTEREGKVVVVHFWTFG